RGEIAQVYATSVESPRLDVSGYNLWYLLFAGRINGISSEIHPAGLPLTYEQIGLGLFALFALLVTALAMHRGGEVALPAAVLSLGFFMFMPQVHERHLFPALAFTLLWAGAGGSAYHVLRRGGRVAGSSIQGLQARNTQYVVRNTGRWLIYGVLSLTYLFNLVTVAPFTPALGTNLVAAPAADAPRLLLQDLSLFAAALNLAILAWLVAQLARRPRFATTQLNNLEGVR
ncbi:MAG: hypothetical protein ACJ78Q_06455, partial [Chloroflexia bacterium]